MFKGYAAKLTVCAVAAAAAIALAGCGGSGGGSQAAQEGSGGGAPAAQEAASDGIGLHDVCYMWDQELVSELNSEGYQQKGTDSEGTTYAKDGTEVVVSEAGGFRIFAFVNDDTRDMYTYVADNAPDVSNLGEYSNGESTFVVGNATVAHEDGVVVSNKQFVFIVLPGHFEQLKSLVSGININNGMSAQTAAARMVQGLNTAGFDLVRGEGIDLGFADATADSSNNAEFEAQVGGSAGGAGAAGATSEQGKQLYSGQWRDPDYGDTLTFNSDGTLTIKQVGEGTTTWWWNETSNGIHIENAANGYDLTLAKQNGTYILYNDSKGVLFEKM